MPRPHLVYRESNYMPEVLRATELLFDAKPWTLDIGVLDLYQRWADVVSDRYGVGPVGVQKLDADSVSGFTYIPGAVPNILIGKYSLATLFCAFGHHLAATGIAVDPIEWGFSLFYSVKPVMFRRRVREGRIFGLTARDTFSIDTWHRLEQMGLTNGNFLVDPQFDIRTLDAEDDLVSPDEVAEAEEDDEEEEEGPDTFYGDDHVAPVIPLRTSDRETLHAQLMTHSITNLRRLSRGLVSGGYRMSKESLVDALINAGVTTP